MYVWFCELYIPLRKWLKKNIDVKFGAGLTQIIGFYPVLSNTALSDAMLKTKSSLKKNDIFGDKKKLLNRNYPE